MLGALGPWFFSLLSYGMHVHEQPEAADGDPPSFPQRSAMVASPKFARAYTAHLRSSLQPLDACPMISWHCMRQKGIFTQPCPYKYH